MRKTKLFLVLLLALLPFVGWAQDPGCHISIKLTNGDSIQYDLWTGAPEIRPQIKNNNIVWSFKFGFGGGFTLDNVESINFPSKEYDEEEVRKALIEFYNAMNGDHWFHKDNWCSDEPIWKWYGVNNYGWSDEKHKLPWVTDLCLQDNNLSGEIPEGLLSKMGPIQRLYICGNNINQLSFKEISNLYSLQELTLESNKLSGSLSDVFKTISQLPILTSISLEGNDFDGTFPDGSIINDYLNTITSVTHFSIRNNHLTGKIPKDIQENPYFPYAWYFILPQKEGLDLSDLDIPAPQFKRETLNGTVINTEDVYKQNEYTLLYKWGWWCPYSEGLNDRLIPVYNAYKDKGFEIIGIHASATESLPDYVKDHPIPWNNIDFDEWISKRWNANKTEGALLDFMENWLQSPTLLLVDQNGNVVFSTLMDENGRMPAATDDRKWKVFDILEEKFGPVEYDLYTSTDYSHDGEVITLQQAFIGQGIDLVFVGEGFTDKDIADGTFEQRMNEACNQFFLYEPYSSLQYRFNVYAVKAVSPNAEYLGNAKHAIEEDISKVFEYASKVPNLKSDRPMYVNVIYNKNSGGRSYCTMLEDNSYVCYAMDGVSNVLNHEAGGHGIGKLLDEYVEAGNESLTLPEEEKTELGNQWTTKGWGANVDWRSNPTEVKWAKFIDDERYKDERIGVYEGSYLYGHGAYRPTENSMMRENYLNSVLGFNAPSREAIYKRVMQESEGDDWTYDYEEFVTFDAAGHQQFVDALNNNRARRRSAPALERQQLTAPPVFLKGTWQDALKKNNK